MLGEMLKDPTAPEVRLYTKTLKNLELSRDERVREDLQTLLQQLVQVHTHTPSVKKLKALGVLMCSDITSLIFEMFI